MFLSIVTITKNDIVGLKDTFKSIDCQSVKDYEWIVIDASSNNTSEIYFKNILNSKKFISKYVHEQDQGIYYGMNKGLGLANSDYIIFMNSGDKFSNSNIIKTLKERIYSSDADFIYGNSYELDKIKQKKIKKSLPHQFIRYGMFTHHQSMIYKRSSIKLPYDVKYKYASDYVFTYRILNYSNTKSLYINIPISTYKLGGVSSKLYPKIISLFEHLKFNYFELNKSLTFVTFLFFSYISRDLFKKLSPSFVKILRKNLTNKYKN